MSLADFPGKEGGKPSTFSPDMVHSPKKRNDGGLGRLRSFRLCFMQDLLRKKLKPIPRLQTIRGVRLPAGLNFIQLVVTGPPGSGKTHYIKTIHGWPNEGYLDLTRQGWWRDRALTFRPREVHLGLPFTGFDEALTVFDREWLDTDPPPLLEPDRIRIPPVSANIFQTDWRHRYVFEFLLPPAKTIFKQRQARAGQGYFPVDEDLSLAMVERQLAVYQQVVLYLHRQQMQVYVRTSLQEPPMCIVEKEDVGIPFWLREEEKTRPRLTTLAGWRWLLLRKAPINWLTPKEHWQPVTRETRIAHDGLPLALKLGKKVLYLYPEVPLGVPRKNLRKNWLVTDPATFGSNLCAFARIQVGESVMIGRANRKYRMLFKLPKNVGKRHLSIINRRGDLVLTPLDDQRPVAVARLTDQDRISRLEARRHDALIRISRLYGHPMRPLPAPDALSLLEAVNAVMAREPHRPLDRHGNPGGLVELDGRIAPIIVGDLHAQVDNLLKILSENKFLEAIEGESAALIILGDAVHSELPGQMEEMDSSVLILDLILTLKKRFPGQVFYLRGNHDTFNPNLCKNGVCQGSLFKRRLLDLRGPGYVRGMERFFASLPHVVLSPAFVACHAGPPRKPVSRDDLINLVDFPETAKELVRSRIRRTGYLPGYSKADVKRFRKGLGLPKKAAFVVGHTPLDRNGSVWLNAGEIKNHHIIYSGRPDGPTLLVGIRRQMVPLSYPAEPLTTLIDKIRARNEVLLDQPD